MNNRSTPVKVCIKESTDSYNHSQITQYYIGRIMDYITHIKKDGLQDNPPAFFLVSNIITEFDKLEQLAISLNGFFYNSFHAINVAVNIMPTEIPSLGLVTSFDFHTPKHIKIEQIILK